MRTSYWNDKGTHQAEADRLQKLMPSSGNCETVAGELIRAATRLYYDFNNNGMGNNTSGAVNFLNEKGAIKDKTYETIHPWTRGRVYDGNFDGDPLAVAMEAVVTETVEFILANPQLETTKNTEDMFEHQEDEQNFCSGCNDVLDDDSYGHMCEDCEEEEERDENTCEGCCVDTRYDDCECEVDDDD